MKKFLSSVSLAALAFCFTLQGSYAMPDEESQTVGVKRVLEKDLEGNPALPLNNGAPFFNPNVTHEQFRDILLPILSPHFPENQIQGFQSSNTIIKPKMWGLRLVCQDWKRAVNFHITHLDLSPIYWTPFEKRAQLVNASGPIQIENLTFSKEGDSCHIQPQDREAENIQFKHLWRTKEFCYNIYSDPVPNPLIEYFTNISIDPLDFPNLQGLVLNDNTGIADKLLKKFINLTYLELNDNTVIAGKSLSKLINLKHLVLSYNDVDYSECLEGPCLEILQYIWDCNDDWNIRRQQEMYVAERLLLSIGKDETKRNDPEFLGLKRKYEIQFLMPNIYDLGTEKRKSTYPYPDNVSYTKEDLEYMTKLTEIKNSSKDGVLDEDDFDSSKDGDLDDDDSDVYEYTCELQEIIDSLIEIGEKNLEIFWDNDSYHS